MPDEQDDTPKLNFNIDPHHTPSYFVDSYLITSTDQTLTLNFAQSVFDSSQQTVVSRITMTAEQSKNFLKNLNDHLEKFER